MLSRSYLASTSLGVILVIMLLLVTDCPASDVGRLIPTSFGKRETTDSGVNGSALQTLRRNFSLRHRLTSRSSHLMSHPIEETIQARNADDGNSDDSLEKRKHHKTTLRRGQHHQGKATFYKTSGQGACGKRNNNGQKIGALSRDVFRMSHCGSMAKVCRADNKNRCVEVQIEDECPGCDSTSLDLTLVAFKGLASKAEGVVEIKWHLL